MPIVTPTAIAIDDSPAVLIADGSTASMGDKIPVIVYNTGTDEVYLGGSDVTKDTGIPLTSGNTFSYDLGPADKLYGICNTGETCTVRVMKGRS